MKGLLLAGGHGTRLRPLTFTGNKHMIPIANQPMLFYGLRHLAESGIRDVAVVLGPLHEGIEEAVRDGSGFGLRVEYVHQGDPKGLAHAVLCARDFLGEDPFVMYLGDNLLQEGAKAFVASFNASPSDAVVGVTPAHDPSAYGVVELDHDRIVSIAEKPSAPRSNLALIGVYLFSSAIHPVIERLKPSARGELEITDAIWQLYRAGHRVTVRRVDGWWKDTGRPEDLLEANDRVLESMPSESFRVEGTVADGAQIGPRVGLGPGSFVGSQVRIEGPSVIGRDVHLDGPAHVGPFSAIGDRCVIRGSSVGRAIFMEGAEIEGPVEMHDCIVGRSARIRAHRGRQISMSCVLGDSTQVVM